MSRFGKKMAAIGIWVGIGVLVGIQFGGSGETVSSPVPGWSVISGSVQGAAPVSRPQAGTVTGLQVQSDGKGGYIYVPVTLAPSSAPQTQAQTQTQPPAAEQPAAGASSSSQGLPQLPAGNYSTLTPGQILVPGEHKSTVDTLADKTAGMLQTASRKGIRWVASWFDSAE
ncbi:hypothetical protein J2Z22_002129 [Paenibacillus forsythiae]|uniref:Uncharacterized protein n=1 Tax=Paenibacillus forsythiae TaxID=365616 RepID=A0ABU3H702_9BACL|nr:hypothetical protein [Paenibacillus forsythiae]MDT3426603.1 hypothetical protein [Paenibacillus forsythiae]